jgi:AAA domain/Topoisomerase DNA binding C4 zinc finger
MDSQPSRQESSDGPNPLLFIKEVAKYFMDFLETDFHRQRTPKRVVRLKDSNSLLVGINLRKYSSFHQKIPYLVSKAFANSLANEISRGSYRAEIPRNLLELVRQESERVSDESIFRIISAVADEIKHVSIAHAKEYDRALSLVTEATEKALKQELVIPLISHLDRPLRNLDLGDENRVFLTQEELTGVLCELLNNKISELLRLTIGKFSVDLERELRSVFDLNEVKSKVLGFFDGLKVGDLFLDLYELERNQKILDKQELYLYFCDISYEQSKYPIFYIPFSLTSRKDVLVIQFDAQVYINKRAIEYVVQEVNEKTGRRGTVKSCAERIIYLARHENDFPEFISSVLRELINVLQLDGEIAIAKPEHQVAKSQLVRISNDSCFVLFDKADESLVNDYEEILRLLALGADNPLAKAFLKLIDDFIYRNPQPFNSVVEEEWDDASPSDRLVFNSPIPLNSEQRQILLALNKDGCNYVTVQGPPGTGKSHTITAVVFDAIQKDQSVLVLSDKKEALDVVEDKIRDTLNKKARCDEHFQNPILRLGRAGSTYSKILSASAMTDIKNHYRAVKREYENIASNIVSISTSLREDIEAEIVSYSEVSTPEIRELIELETLHSQSPIPIDLAEFLNNSEGAPYLEDMRATFARLRGTFGPNSTPANEMSRVLGIFGWQNKAVPPPDIDEILERAASVDSVLSGLQTLSEENLNAVRLFETFSKLLLPVLRSKIQQYDDCRNRFFGYLFRGRKLEAIDNSAQNEFNFSFTKKPHILLPQLRQAFEAFVAINRLTQDVAQPLGGTWDALGAVHQILVHPELRTSLGELVELRNDCAYLRKDVFPYYSKTLQIAGVSEDSTSTWLDNWLVKISQREYDQLLRHISLSHKLEKAFASIPDVNYGDEQSNLEELVTVQMTHLLDERVIEFYEHNKSTASALRDVIRSKTRFPKNEFSVLKKAFPCILAGIRDYAEYIPLESEVFDLLIIDEASQVSVAQAFPALLRAKKVLILGDKKQFSNIKAAQARSETNYGYVNQLREVFIKNVSDESDKMVRLEKFNIKSSILEFFERITNYQIQLSKYFRGYKEIISFSNNRFYQDRLQVMKIRGKPIDEVLKFTFVTDDGKRELGSKSNNAEVDFIVSELQRLKASNSTQSVGIITPHTNQQKLLIETINGLPEKNYMFDNFKLKIMTFDTCQGEERDVIYYSMVATASDDRLWGVFIKDLGNVDVEEEGQIKAQRLNVGLSRAKECMHFIVSKRLDEFKGSIGEALRHYDYTLKEARKERSTDDVDRKSGMEPQVLNWFYQTKFWHENKERVEIIPQFELGKYLKQLKKTYDHPMYRVDFLLIVKEADGERKFILEYDGFHEHFVDLPGINARNYADYYTQEDVYRQKVLEGYGYRFLRINRFNAGKNPIQTLSDRLYELLTKDRQRNSAVKAVHSVIDGIENGDLKECPRCKELKPLGDFENKALVSGKSRFCAACRPKQSLGHRQAKTVAQSVPSIFSAKNCPRCSSPMVMRRSRRGRFWGCTKFPYCRATATVNV